MLHLKILAVGKIKEKYLRDALQEYIKRLSGHVKIDIMEVSDEPTPDKPSEAEADKVKKLEGERILKLIKPDEYMVLLDIEGKEIDSVEHAKFLSDKALAGQSTISFIIGGSLGVSDDIKKKADFRWSFSKLTFPHQLVRLILLEQIYRAIKINKGEPYHK